MANEPLPLNAFCESYPRYPPVQKISLSEEDRYKYLRLNLCIASVCLEFGNLFLCVLSEERTRLERYEPRGLLHTSQHAAASSLPAVPHHGPPPPARREPR